MGKFIQSNTVILATNFNPTICTHPWLIKKEIVKEDEFIKEGCIYSPPFVRVLTGQYELTILPERVQLGFRQPEEDHSIELRNVLGGLVNALPETPYQALGFNFIWLWQAREQSRFSDLIRRAFIGNENPIARHFSNDDARFGMYMSKNVAEMRMKLDIKPVRILIRNTPEERLQIAFNLEKQVVGGDIKEQIVQLLDQWNSMKNVASSIEADLETGLDV